MRHIGTLPLPSNFREVAGCGFAENLDEPYIFVALGGNRAFEGGATTLIRTGTAATIGLDSSSAGRI